MGKNAQAKEIKKEISEFDIVCHIKQYEKSNRSFHWHERYEICQVLSGECKFLVDGQMLTAGVGDVICGFRLRFVSETEINICCGN